MQNTSKFQILFDKEFRQKITQNPSKYAEQLGIEIADGIEAVVIKNTKDTTYIPFSPVGIQESDMLAINAAVQASSVASVSSTTTLSTGSSTFSSASTAGTFGSVDVSKV